MANLNYSAVSVLLGQNVKLVRVKFAGPKEYDYKTTIDFEIGDLAVVYTPTGGYKVVNVVQTEELEVKDDVEYKWIVDKVHTAAFQSNIAKELELCSRIRQLDNQNKQVQLLNALGLDKEQVKLPKFR